MCFVPQCPIVCIYKIIKVHTLHGRLRYLYTYLFYSWLILRYDVLKTCVKLVTLPNIFVVSYRVATYCFELIPFSKVIFKAVEQNGTKIHESEKLYAYSIFILFTAFAYPSLADY